MCYAPLKDYGNFSWYDPKDIKPTADFSLVVCDGPPHDTAGGRYGLLPVMQQYIGNQAVILLDDYIRSEEKSIVVEWQKDFLLTVTSCGENDMYARIIYEGEC